jgi:hypothetical protein
VPLERVDIPLMLFNQGLRVLNPFFQCRRFHLRQPVTQSLIFFPFTSVPFTKATTGP